MPEKKITEITVRLSETLKNDLQDVAAYEDRKLSEIIRIAFETFLYGHHRAATERLHADSCKTTQGDAV